MAANKNIAKLVLGSALMAGSMGVANAAGMSCGAGKCGAKKGTKAMKCGAGKCGGKKEAKDAKAKCGAGKCGAKKETKAKCGAGKCGGKK